MSKELKVVYRDFKVKYSVIPTEQIKSIVTKQQFAQMEYKVKD